MVEVLVILVVLIVGGCIYYYNLPDDELDEKIYGKRNPDIICPHCHAKGKVHTKEIDKKVGISGAKATAAVLTGGVSVLAIGLSRKDHLTQAHCCKCESTWAF
jgi:hypothetical protein